MRDVLIVGSGVGSLATAVELAGQGLDIEVLEREGVLGGKVRQVEVDGRAIDVGPTVMTMRWVFDELFASTGASFDDYVALTRASTLARHAFPGRLAGTLDLFGDSRASEDEIGRKIGLSEARGFRAFCDYAAKIHALVEPNFLRAQRLTPTSAVVLAAKQGVALFSGIDAMRTLSRALGDFFRDPRLLQLFGRYATYCGSSPFAAPATLNVIAHVEQAGVWLVEGGMRGLVRGLERRARELGVTFRTGAHVASIDVEAGRASGVTLREGERIAARAVVHNGDTAALAGGLLGASARRAVPAPSERSLSAVTFAFVAKTRGLELARHNVVFSSDYTREFHELERGLPSEPTVYVCAQDRGENCGERPERERLFVLVNAPATGEAKPFSSGEIESCRKRVESSLASAGLTLEASSEAVVSTPADFARRFPGTNGALYGPASHGMMSAFARSGASTRIPGLFVAGGSAHPGAGVPMAALSGRLASEKVLEHLASTARSRRTATPGGTSTSSATMVASASR